MYDCRFPQKLLRNIPNKNNLKLKEEEEHFLKNLIDKNYESRFDTEKDFISILPYFKDHLQRFTCRGNYQNPLYIKIDEILKKYSQAGHISLLKMKELIHEETGKTMSKSTLSRIIRNKLGYTYRKTNVKNIKVTSLQNITSSFLFIKVLTRAIIKNLFIIFIDESGIRTDNQNFRSWVKEGFQYAFDFGVRVKSNLIMGVSSERVIHFEMNRENTDADIFLGFIDRLYEKLTDDEKRRCLIVMDNASFHRTSEIIKNFKNKKLRVLFNSPYKSEFNPIGT
jgi:hypothetical protein